MQLTKRQTRRLEKAERAVTIARDKMLESDLNDFWAHSLRRRPYWFRRKPPTSYPMSIKTWWLAGTYGKRCKRLVTIVNRYQVEDVLAL